YHATSVQSSRSRRAGFWLLHLCRVAFAADAELEREERSHSHRLFWLNANRWNDLRPMVDLADEEAGEFHRRAAQWVQALKLHFGDNVRHLQPATAAALSLSMIGAGAPAGASRPFQPTLMTPGTVSSIVGVSGNS